jgi:hemolysin activation/secretion protein
MKKCLLTLLFAFCFISIASAEDVLIKGIVLTKESTQISSENLKKIQGIYAINIKVPGGYKWLQKHLSPYLGKKVTPEILLEIKKSIITYFREFNYPLLIVKIPESDISLGVLRFDLVQSKLGKILVEGDKHFSKEFYAHSVSLRTGEFLNEKTIIKDVFFLNQNPFHHVDVVYQPGEEKYTTDLKLLVEDKFPLRIYAGTDNRGLRYIDKYRWFAGFNWGNFLWLNQILSYQYTVAYDCRKFQAHTVDYKIPMPWSRHMLTFFGGYSFSHANLDNVIEGAKQHGRTAQVSFRYDAPFGFTRWIKQNAQVGFDYKKTNTTLEYTEINPIINGKVNLTQVVLGYSNTCDCKNYKSSFEVSAFWSPGRWLSNQTDEIYNSFRYRAVNHYFYVLGKWNHLICLPLDFTLSLALSGQAANHPLLQSEMFPVGGAYSVRGYDERELNGDAGFQGNLEIRSPKLNWNIKRLHEGLQLIGFLDYGYVNNFEKIEGTRKADSIIGIGPGLRYVIEQYFSAAVDWGIKLRQNHRFGPSHGRLHFDIQLSY